MGYYVYMVRCQDNTLYTGSTNNINKRIAAHNSGKGAKYTAPRRPVSLVYLEDCADRATALSRESALKKLSRTQKLALIVKYNTAKGI